MPRSPRCRLLTGSKRRPHLTDVTDGLSNTISLAESAGRPFVYRKAGGLINADQIQNRVNGGGWARAANDFAIEGSNNDGTFQNNTSASVSNPPYGSFAVNCTNGQDVGSAGLGAGSWPLPYYNTEGTGEVFSFHPAGANAAFGDGSVHFIRAEIAMNVFAAIVTRSQQEPATNY